jgi:hypothetical protein
VERELQRHPGIATQSHHPKVELRKDNPVSTDMQKSQNCKIIQVKLKQLHEESVAASSACPHQSIGVRSMKRARLNLVVVAAMLMSMLTSCTAIDKWRAVSIGKLIENPREYVDKRERISGTVTSRMDLMVVQYFVLADDSGEIIVITKKSLPIVGNKLTVVGRLKEGISLLQHADYVFIEEPEKGKD